MASLPCPLCCNKVFPNRATLKNHLLGILNRLEHLSCSICEKRCTDLGVLVKHLDECSKKSTTKEVEVAPNMVPLKPKLEVDSEENEDEDNRIEEEQVDNGEENTETLYSCEMCKVTFTDIQKHLSKYHQGEEVILETEEPEEDGNQDDTMIATDGNEDEYMSQVESQDESADELTNSTGKSRKQQNCTSDTPLIVRYVIENGEARPIEKHEESNYEESKIISVYNCQSCTLQFPSLKHFEKHSCTASSKKIEVNKVKRSKIREKIKEIQRELKYQCTFCMAVYSSVIALNDHMQSHLAMDETGMVQKKTVTMSLHICDICNIKFATYKQLRLHYKIHEPVKNKGVDPPVSYNIHGQHSEENAQPDNAERETFICGVCDKTYDKSYEEVHLKSHVDQSSFTCLVCNRVFDSKPNLDLHTKVHSNVKKFSCSYCKKSFLTYVALEEHVAKQCHEREFECQYCGRRFSRPHEKVKHERIHTGEKPHVCDICGKAFRIGYCLTLHMRTHTGNRPYTCEQCGKRFKSHSVYDHHLKTHSEERNYKCPFCPKAFKTAVQLAGHKNSHTKPFSCTICNRPFASLYAVRIHMDTHQRENNLKHECWVCGATYARSFALRDHLSEVHGQKSSAAKDDTENSAMEVETTDDSQTEINNVEQGVAEEQAEGGQEETQQIEMQA